MADHFVSVDLGKYVDPTALAVMCRSLAIDSDTGLPVRDSRGEEVYRWEVRALKRYPLGTPYVSIVNDVIRICERPELNPGVRLCLDASGVGVAVTEMFSRALVDHKGIECAALSITGGEGWSVVRDGQSVRRYRVAKSQLIGTIREILESRRFKVSRDPATGKPVEFAEVLLRELANFREKITEAGNATYEARQGQHDDLILATAIGCWWGSQRWCRMVTRGAPEGMANRLQPREVAGLVDAQAKLEADELEALKREKEQESESRLATWQVRQRTEKELREISWSDDRWWQ